MPGCRFVARLAFTAVTSRKQSTKLVLLRYLKSNLAGIDPVARFAIRESLVPILSLSLSRARARARILRFFELCVTREDAADESRDSLTLENYRRLKQHKIYSKEVEVQGTQASVYMFR